MIDKFKIKIGNMVVLESTNSKYYKKTGEIVEIDRWRNRFLVQFSDGVSRWYTDVSLSLANKTNEKENNVMELKNYKSVVGVNFTSGTNTTKEYFFACYENDIAVGDIVLCDTVNGISVAKVVVIHETNPNEKVKITKEIICKVDINAFIKRKETRKRAIELKERMNKRIKELQDITMFEMMAKTDETLSKMLEEFKSIDLQ